MVSNPYPGGIANPSYLFGGQPEQYLDAPGSAATADWINELKDAGDPIATYAEHVQWTVKQAGDAAHRHRRSTRLLTLVVVGATFVAAALAAVVSATGRTELAVIAAVLSALVGAATTWGKTTQWSELASANHVLAVGLDWELTHFKFGAGPYRPEYGGRDPRMLIERCEALAFKVQLENEN